MSLRISSFPKDIPALNRWISDVEDRLGKTAASARAGQVTVQQGFGRAPDPPTAITVTGINGVFTIKITPNSRNTIPTYYTAQASDTSNFLTTESFSMGKEALFKVAYPNVTKFWRVYAYYLGSLFSNPIVFGGAVPTSVASGGLTTTVSDIVGSISREWGKEVAAPDQGGFQLIGARGYNNPGVGTSFLGTTTLPPAVEFVSSATLNNKVFIETFNESLCHFTNRQLTMKFAMYFPTGEPTQVRFMSGLTDQTISTLLGSDIPAGQYTVFRWTFGVDTNFQCITSNGSVQTITDSGITPAANTFYIFELNYIGNPLTKVNYKINGTQVASHITNLPTANAFTHENGTNNLDANAHKFRVHYVYFEYDLP